MWRLCARGEVGGSGRAGARYPTLPRKKRASRMGHPVVEDGHPVGGVG